MSTDLLTLPEARAALRVPSSDTSNDADLSTYYIPAITEPVEDVIGPVVTQSFTRTFDGGVNSIVLLGHSNVTVTAVVENGIALASPNDYTVDPVAGIVSRGGPLAPLPFFYSRQGVSITWQAGMFANTAAVAPAIKLAARIILRHAWQSDQPGRSAVSGGMTDANLAATPSGFLIPSRAMELLKARARHPGFA